MQNEDAIPKKRSAKKLAGGKHYEFPAHEAHLVHAEIRTPQFDPTTGEDKSIGFVQKFYPKEFEEIEKTNGFAGRKVTVLHNGDADAELEDVGPNEHLEPKILSSPGAGTPLDVDLSTASDEDIEWLHEKYVGKKVEGTIESKKAELLKASGFLRDQRVQEEFKTRANNIATGTKGAAAESANVTGPAGSITTPPAGAAAGAGLSATSGTGKAATGGGNAK